MASFKPATARLKAWIGPYRNALLDAPVQRPVGIQARRQVSIGRRSTSDQSQHASGPITWPSPRSSNNGSTLFYYAEEELFNEISYNLMHLMYVFRVCRLSFLGEERPAIWGRAFFVATDGLLRARRVGCWQRHPQLGPQGLCKLLVSSSHT